MTNNRANNRAYNRAKKILARSQMMNNRANNIANNRANNRANKALARSQVGESHAGLSSFTWGCSLCRLIGLTISLHVHT